MSGQAIEPSSSWPPLFLLAWGQGWWWRALLPGAGSSGSPDKHFCAGAIKGIKGVHLQPVPTLACSPCLESVATLILPSPRESYHFYKNKNQFDKVFF